MDISPSPGGALTFLRTIFQLMRDMSSDHLQNEAAHCDLCANFFKKTPRVHDFKDASTNRKRLKLKALKQGQKTSLATSSEA